MAYQNVRRADPRPSSNTASVNDKPTKDALDKLRDDYGRLAQEVIDCHNLILNFALSIGTGLTTIAVTLPVPMKATDYVVNANFNFNNGGWWATAKTLTGFTLNWATATVGTQAVRILIVG